MKRIVLFATLVVSVVGLGGCLVVAAGAGAAGTVAYFKGELSGNFSRDVPAVYNASLTALNDLKIPVISSGQDALSANIVARDAQDKKVTISIKRAGETTQVTIRVGFWGDQAKSQTIYDKIKDHL
jgi:hypothetical protein